MIFHPSILALYVASILICFMVLYSASYGLQILRRWDIRSGSEEQLVLERKTYLISTLLSYVFSLEIISLFFFVFTVDQLHTFFVGAMCAAGTLYVNSYGYPVLILKVINFLLAGLWLVVNYADNQGYDYPLIKKKYLFLLLLTPLIVAEVVLQANYFLRLDPNIITSCCGSLFSVGEKSLTSEVSAFPIFPMEILFYLSMALTIAFGLFFLLRSKGGYLLACFSGWTFIVSMASIFSFISVYVYELPTHHCPFCVLQKEYFYVGYLLYLTLFGGTLSGMGVGLLMPFRNINSLSGILPSLQKRFAAVSLTFFIIFTALVTCYLFFSNLILQ
ncbi:MAG: hypothetical protein HY787_09520 [Deltaproteobacteria bacterium]|nr:hypothetical protein [Deltaproteobacteria bacterium]